VQFGPALFAANGVVTAIPLFGANTTGEANSINASGIAVGYQTAAGVNTAFLYKNGIVYNLNDYLPASFVALGWYLSIADVITDDGYILGRGKLGGLDASWLMCVSALA
jgi:probable HAF family extracellular repeat protein